MGNKKRRRTIDSVSSKKPHPPRQTSNKAAAPARNEAPTIPFHGEDRILLIGEGDFSFAKSIVETHGCYNVTATCFDKREEMVDKYQPQGEEHVSYLEDEGQTVFYAVDATKLDQNKQIKKACGAGWNVIMFNFPHVGGKSKDVNRQVRFNQELIVKYFTTAQSLLSKDGTIVVTLFEGEPYTLWNVRDLARHSGLQVVRSFRFQASAYPGYSHARTLGNIEGGGGWKGEDRDARSFVFGRKLDIVAPSAKNHKRKRDGDSEDDEG